MIFQTPENQIVGTTVEEDVAFGPGNLRLPAGQIRALVDNALARVGLAAYSGRHPHTLSGGEKQLLALAGILSMSPRYLVLDEPTSSLDPVSKANVLSIIREFSASGIGIIHITHHLEDVVCAARAIVIAGGGIAADGPPSEIFYRVDWLKSLGLAPPVIAEVMWRLGEGRDMDTAVLDIEEAVKKITSKMSRTSSRPPAVPEQSAAGEAR